MNIGNNSSAELRSFVERIEKIEAEKDELAEDVRGIYKEAKNGGYDVPALRAVIRRRKQDVDKAQLLEDTIETYRAALGDLDGTPLGRAAIERAGVGA